MFLMMLPSPWSAGSAAPPRSPVFMTAVGIGFTLLIASGVASALGEVGLIRRYLAGWLPPLLLGLMVLGLATRDGWRGPGRAGR